MRTQGTFQEVYEAAKSYYKGTAIDGSPINPVIRREEDQWMLESNLNPTDGDFEITLDDFDSYFYEVYIDDNYIPNESDIEDFLRAHNE